MNTRFGSAQPCGIYLSIIYAVKKKELKSSQSSAIVNLPPVNLSQSSAIDLRLGTQDFLESCMKNLSQDTFVKGFDPSQVKAEDSLDWLEPPTSLKIFSSVHSKNVHGEAIELNVVFLLISLKISSTLPRFPSKLYSEVVELYGEGFKRKPSFLIFLEAASALSRVFFA
ncbi:hypothetical protein Bca4012_041205 [Brassica carinata]